LEIKAVCLSQSNETIPILKLYIIFVEIQDGYVVERNVFYKNDDDPWEEQNDTKPILLAYNDEVTYEPIDFDEFLAEHFTELL